MVCKGSNSNGKTAVLYNQNKAACGIVNELLVAEEWCFSPKIFISCIVHHSSATKSYLCYTLGMVFNLQGESPSKRVSSLNLVVVSIRVANWM